MEAFFMSGSELAKIFTNPRWTTYDEKYGFEFETAEGEIQGGLKPIEAFCADILCNLVKWASNETTIFYKTKKYWYTFEKSKKLPKLITMTRYNTCTWERVDDRANLHSVEEVGKMWLLKPKQLSKRVPLFDDGQTKKQRDRLCDNCGHLLNKHSSTFGCTEKISELHDCECMIKRVG